jgi:nucleoside phosphorylase
MSFRKSAYFRLHKRCPADLASALAAAMAKANGAGRPFAVDSLSYSLEGGVRYKADQPKLADLQVLTSFPAGFALTVTSGSSRDSNVAYATARLEDDRLDLTASARAVEALDTFFDAFSRSFDTEKTVSVIDEFIASTEQARDGESSGLLESTRSPRVSAEPPRVLIFTALQEERDILEAMLGLQTAFEDGVARGVRHGVPIDVISGRRMGRVPAAVAVTAHLATTNYPFQLIIVAGIAGGFAEAGMQTGAVVIANDVVDLATRKKLAEETEFRPTVYSTDEALERFTKSSSFNKSEWEQALVTSDRWPDGRRPYLQYGALASTDEVVSSHEWRQELRSAWPKLLGVEMEAGGVCAAAERFGHKVTVIRGISDLADPRKSDDHWRRLAMRSVVAVIDAMLLSGVLGRSARVHST